MTQHQLRHRNSSIFRAYAGARREVRAGKLDAGRVNRALGLALRVEYVNEYATTLDGCQCPDYQYREGPKGLPCKHILALALQTLAAQERISLTPAGEAALS
jgi:hypothetical protein